MAISNSRFEFNDGLNCGAILQRGGIATLRNVDFVENQPRAGGGVYYLYGDSTTTPSEAHSKLHPRAATQLPRLIAGSTNPAT